MRELLLSWPPHATQKLPDVQARAPPSRELSSAADKASLEGLVALGECEPTQAACLETFRSSG